MFPASLIQLYGDLRTSRKGWVLGMLISIILPFCRNKWGALLLIKGKGSKGLTCQFSIKTHML